MNCFRSGLVERPLPFETTISRATSNLEDGHAAFHAAEDCIERYHLEEALQWLEKCVDLLREVMMSAVFAEHIERPKRFEPDAVHRFPLNVVCSWLGNTEAVAKKSYLLVTDSDFERSIEPEALNCKSEAKPEAAGTRDEEHENEESLENHRGNVIFPTILQDSQVEVWGLEQPSNSLERTHNNSDAKHNPKQLLQMPIGLAPIDDRLKSILDAWPKLCEHDRDQLARIAKGAFQERGEQKDRHQFP